VQARSSPRHARLPRHGQEGTQLAQAEVGACKVGGHARSVCAGRGRRLNNGAARLFSFYRWVRRAFFDSIATRCTPPLHHRLCAEDAALLRGTAQFGDDVLLPDALHIAFVRSTQAHAQLLRIDAATALRLPGVHTVLTARELGRHAMPTPNPLLRLLHNTHFELLAHETVAYVGQAVAVVLANSPRQAREAAAQVRLLYEPLPAVGDFANDSPATARTQHHHGTLPHSAQRQRAPAGAAA